MYAVVAAANSRWPTVIVGADQKAMNPKAWSSPESRSALIVPCDAAVQQGAEPVVAKLIAAADALVVLDREVDRLGWPVACAAGRVPSEDLVLATADRAGVAAALGDAGGVGPGIEQLEDLAGAGEAGFTSALAERSIVWSELPTLGRHHADLTHVPDRCRP